MRKEVDYEYRGYCYERTEPLKNQITANAMRHMTDFIEGAKQMKTDIDWLLTKRQNQIMGLMVDGLDRKQIAEAMDVEDTTIRTQIADIYDRYGLEGGNKCVKAVITFLKRTGKLDNT